MRCEDFPCCGHEDGDCPDSEGRFRCCICDRLLEKNSRSSICSSCNRRMAEIDRDDPTGQDLDYFLGDY